MSSVCTVGPKVMVRKGESITGFDHVAAKAAKLAAPHSGNSSWLGQDGKPVNVSGDDAALVADVLARIDDLMRWNDYVFGIRGDGGSVILTNSGTNGGAFHSGCDFVQGNDWNEALYSPPAPAGSPGGITFGLCQAEIVESYMGKIASAKTIDCGDSFGEALSRYCAMSVTGGTNGSMGTSGFVSATSWTGGNWIDNLSGTDGDYDSTGCGMVYISWMLSQGFTIAQLTQAGGPTCADNYAVLTGKPKSAAWPAFHAAVQAMGGTAAISNDNPFKAPDPVYPAIGGPVPPQTCPVGQHWDATLGKCVPDAPVPPTPTVPPNYAVTGTFTKSFWSSAGQFVGTATPIPTGQHAPSVSTINWIQIGLDAFQVISDVFAKNWQAVATDVITLLTDLGIVLPFDQQQELRKQIHRLATANIVWWAVIADAFALFAAVRTFNVAAIISAATKLLMDMGIIIPTPPTP